MSNSNPVLSLGVLSLKRRVRVADEREIGKSPSYLRLVTSLIVSSRLILIHFLIFFRLSKNIPRYSGSVVQHMNFLPIFRPLFVPAHSARRVSNFNCLLAAFQTMGAVRR
jgi:hypothetical protein